MASQLDDLTLESLTLWDSLKPSENAKECLAVKELVGNANSLLGEIRQAFYTYTLHDAKHAGNVAKLMADLLGPHWIKELKPLEAALLILSAYWHDVGMVFSKEERAKLSQLTLKKIEDESSWQKFFRKNPEAYLDAYQSFKKTDTVSDKIIEWYCRWSHAGRVINFLHKEKAENLCWGSISFKKELAGLCRSHNDDANEITNNTTLENNYLEQADLKFCAIILRLADILDFDNSRAPDALYRLLELQSKRTSQEKRSDSEWRNHMASEGFKFEHPAPERCEADFSAGPRDPEVECNIRSFLDIIEDEIKKCIDVLPSCSERWRNFPLPNKINRHIKGAGYTYGEYRFLLDQKNVLNLLMGENLYEDRHVFVRELIQNAIDTSRDREYREQHLHGNKRFSLEPIRVSEWRDQDGQMWVRIDDFGMGMNKRIISDHLLQVGSSYYDSSEFKAKVTRAQTHDAPEFMPISRFGIGLLSCFIIGDAVEISTRHWSGYDSAEPIRLSLNRLHGFYTLQTGMDDPKPMPTKAGKEFGYRDKPGTSIAVRIDPKKDWGFDLRATLEKHVLSSKIPIEFEGELIGHDFASLIERPWCERRIVSLGSEEMKQFTDLTGYQFSKPLELELVPLDLTKHSPDPEFKGQMMMIVFQPTDEWLNFQKAIDPFAKIIIKQRDHGFAWPLDDHFSFHFVLKTKDYIVRDELISEIEAKLLEDEQSPFSSAFRQLRDRLNTAIKKEILDPHPDPAPTTLFEQDSHQKNVDEKQLFHAETACVISVKKAIEALPPVIQKAIHAIDKRKHSTGLISHNGVVIPSRVSATEFGLMQFNPVNPDLKLHGPLDYDALSWGTVALADSLRPDVDVSRGSLRKVPLKVYANAMVSFYGSLTDTGMMPFCQKDFTDFTTFIDKDIPSLRQLKDIVALVGEWTDFPLFQISERQSISLRELQAQVKRDEEVELWMLPGRLRFNSNGSSYRCTYSDFAQLCADTLAQYHLKLQLRVKKNVVDGFFVLSGSPQAILPGQEDYPPFTFLPYSDDSVLLLEGCGVNINHPFSKWLLNITPTLAEQYPGIFGELKSLLMDVNFGRWLHQDEINWRMHWQFEPSKCYDSLTAILKEMKEMEKFKNLKFSPPSLKKSDIQKPVGKEEESADEE